MERLENNVLLALFMGAVHIGNNHYEFPDKTIHPPFAMKYAESWDWLMPVVDKIEKLEVNGKQLYQFYIVETESWITENEQEVENHPKDQFIHSGETKIEAVYKTCVTFIKWYNENKK